MKKPAENFNEAQNAGSTIDPTRLGPVAGAQGSIFQVFYVWGEKAKSLRSASGAKRPEQMQTTLDTLGICLMCFDCSYNRPNCPKTGCSLKVFRYKYCKTATLRTKREGACCRAKYASEWGVSSKRSHRDTTSKSSEICTLLDGLSLDELLGSLNAAILGYEVCSGQWPIIFEPLSQHAISDAGQVFNIILSSLPLVKQ